ncbi:MULTISPECIES: DUF86 domain-containing protein [unclassified Methanoregula]|uniref:HepT-like ribonuclease domain-containing protein n=1 Tax=unclassified Methanoregula TaxID=2649730 RepID=UPI0009CC1694|nr:MULTISPECIES: DUF86 domain-containing protein [unclassified Methanoregula]OPX62193.1 MAG: hypothetical protein A4E33_02459 [Methanoregula sp. PtaB.Bin085]OPY35598.1 MAG: hypothetical protein A4E34_00598 [Methanoregula sp. PtaU1.Bin006]
MVRDDAYLLDILLMAKDAHEFIRSQTRDSFSADRQCQYAVIRCLEVIGEVSKRLSPETIQRFAAIEWSAMARMRDMLIHSYGKVDLDEIWDTVTTDIPRLIAILEPEVLTEEQD